MNNMGLVGDTMRNSKCGRVVGLDFRPLCNESNNGLALEDLGSMSKSEKEGSELAMQGSTGTNAGKFQRDSREIQQGDAV